ncbi:MAG: putative peptidoglycan glycosyltransferase FtsW [Pseudomonadota bacterium]
MSTVGVGHDAPEAHARGPLTAWWLTVDRVLLAAILALFAIGAVTSLAASPAVALQKGYDPFYFVERHLIFAGLALGVMFAASMMSPRGVRRAALGVFAVAVVGLVLVLTHGDDINGSQRWLRFATFSVQPSEFLKPGFVVLAAWAFSQVDARRDMPAFPLAAGLLVLSVMLLALQPDVGQAALISAAWGGLMLMSGLSLIWLVGLGVVAGGAGLLAYLQLDYVRGRIDAFLSSSISGTDQTGRALRSFIEGGFFGRGPGAGEIKSGLPDAHTDFIFAVVAEEYGVIACLVIVALFGLLAARMVQASLRARATADRFALIGIALIISGQALINMGVNVGLLPAKGMTLPLISAGGSSMCAIALTLGFALALGRATPTAAAEPAEGEANA